MANAELMDSPSFLSMDTITAWAAAHLHAPRDEEQEAPVEDDLKAKTEEFAQHPVFQKYGVLQKCAGHEGLVEKGGELEVVAGKFVFAEHVLVELRLTNSADFTLKEVVPEV
jgi:hypothetical protein